MSLNFEFFLVDNKSGYKTRESWVRKNHKSFYNKLTIFIKKYNLNDISFKEKIYHYFNNLTKIPKCKYCGKPLKFGRSLQEGYPIYCSLICTNKDVEHKEKVKITNNQKYNGNAPSCSNVIKNKMKKTTLDKHGVENIFEKKKYIQSKINEKYGNPIMTKTLYYQNLMSEKYEEKHKNFNILKNQNDIEYYCVHCNKTSKLNYNNFNYRIKNNINLCLTCVEPKVSSLESDLILFLEDYGIKYIRNNRVLIKPLELDFYLPDFNLAIEMHGLYYHSELFHDEKYHYLKYQKCKNINIELIQIFEDEWKFKKDIVLSLLKNKLNLNNNCIYARKCQIKEISSLEYSTFLNKNHIQGNVKTKYKIGLFNKNELIQVIGFSSLRRSLGSKPSDKKFELIRSVTKLNTNVIGGFSKLLKYFIKKYNPIEIISYCDLRYFNGKSYLKNNFDFIKITKPNYFYVKIGTLIRLNRYNFRKSELIKKGYDKNKTEKIIMQEKNYFRVYDVGNIKFMLKL